LNTRQPTTVVRLYLLQLALGDDGTPIPGYLIQTNDGKNILIDSGVPTDGSFVPMGGQHLKMSPVVDQLTALGLTPRDIHFLVCTHFDPDHSGCHDEFIWSELIVQRTHYEFARASDSPRFILTRSHWDHTGLRYRLVEGDTTLVPGVDLIDTSGHVPGHQSVLVRLPHTGPVLLAIDAAAMEDDLNRMAHQEDNKGDLNPAAAQASAAKMLELVEREQVRLVVYGHDENRWPALKKAPEFYE